MYRGESTVISNFGGGLHSNSAATEVQLDESWDSSNIIIGPAARYFRTRNGDTAFNASAMSSGAAVQGLSYFKTNSANEFLVATCGTKLFSSGAGLSGTMSDITGSLTITSSQDDLWTQFSFNNKHIGFGGPPTSPDAPWVWTGSGNAAALGGTPPSAYGAFQANNRVFAFRTSANPSRIYWSVLNDHADWTGVGSGNADVWASDNDSITACATLNNSVVVIFKQNSIHKMLISNLVSGAFPIFPITSGVGCAGKHACVVADGLCYFVTNQGRMKATDGDRIYDIADFPRLPFIDDLWAATASGRWAYIDGRRVVGSDYDHIWWAVTSASSGSTNDHKFIWDLKNKCWLRDKTGYATNASTTTQTGVVYTGGYDGVIYKKDVTNTTTDASNSSAAISSYRTSGWYKDKSIEQIKQPRKVSISFVSQTSGTLVFSYGFDFSSFQQTFSIDQRTNAAKFDQDLFDVGLMGEPSDLLKSSRMVGRGNVFQYQLSNNDGTMKINTIEFSGKSYGQKTLEAS